MGYLSFAVLSNRQISVYLYSMINKSIINFSAMALYTHALKCS